jgi:hypothetical protein
MKCELLLKQPELIKQCSKACSDELSRLYKIKISIMQHDYKIEQDIKSFKQKMQCMKKEKNEI